MQAITPCHRKRDATFTIQIASESISEDLKAKNFLGGMPPDPPKWCMCCHTLFNRPLKLSLCCVLPPLVIFSKRNPETGQHPQLFPYSASSINATAWSHSTPQTLTSTSKQILHYNKHLYHSCWYLKGTVYKAVASCENCETILGLHSMSMNFFNVLPATCFCCFLGVREIICCGSAR